MSGKLLLGNFDGSLDRLELLPACEETRAVFHLRYWDREERPVEAALTFTGVIAVSFSVNYFDNPIGAELFGLYELEDEAEKAAVIRKNFRLRRQTFLLTGYDGYDPEDEDDLLNNTRELERALAKKRRYHLYHQQTQGGTYCLVARGYELEDRYGPVDPGADAVAGGL